MYYFTIEYINIQLANLRNLKELFKRQENKRMSGISMREFCRASDRLLYAELTPLHQAAYEGNIFQVRHLLEAGADVDAQDSWSWTALHDAAIEGHAEIVKLLLAAKADPNKQDNEDYYTPLHEKRYR